MSRRAALYARVSTAHQEQDQTVDSQLSAIAQATAALGLSVPSERRYVDEGFSGSRLDRPGLDALRDAAADGLIDIVVMHGPDRLARNFVHQHVIVEELTKRGVEVHFVERPIGERAEDRLLLQMQGVIAEYERAKIIERTRRGMRHKVRSGQTLPFSRPPYGYAIVRTPDAPGGVVLIDEVAAEHVRSMYRWVIDEGIGIKQVAKRLNELGVRPRHREFWVSTSVYHVLINPAYAGTAVYGQREAVEPKRPRKPGTYRRNQRSSTRVRPSTQWIEVAIPPIVDIKTREAVLAQLARNKCQATRNTKHDYLLRTLVVCGQCQKRMSAKCHISSGGRYRYFHYRCDHRDPVVTGSMTRCTARQVLADDLDKVVWEALVPWIQTPEMLLREIAAWRSSRAGAPQLSRDRARVQKVQRQLGGQIERLIDAYQRGAISLDELKARRERLEAERDAARLRAEDLLAEESDRTRLDRLGDDLEAFASTLRAGLNDLDFAGRQRIVRLLVERVVVTGDEVAIEHAIPLNGRFRGDPQRAVTH